MDKVGESDLLLQWFFDANGGAQSFYHSTVLNQRPFKAKGNTQFYFCSIVASVVVRHASIDFSTMANGFHRQANNDCRFNVVDACISIFYYKRYLYSDFCKGRFL
jgi:hypothetical protein